MNPKANMCFAMASDHPSEWLFEPKDHVTQADNHFPKVLKAKPEACGVDTCATSQVLSHAFYWEHMLLITIINIFSGLI